MIGRVRAHQLAAYFLATFVVSWLFWIPSAALFAGADDADHLITTPLFIVLQTLGAVGPSAVALALTRALHGREAVRALLARFKPERSLWRWYVVAASVAPALTLIALLLDAVAFGRPFIHPDSGLADMAVEMGWFGAVAMLPVVLASQIFSSPLLEEGGWRGFALPRMQRKADALTASLGLGLLWGIWHLPLVIAYGDPFAPYLAGIVAYTVLMTWVFNSGGGNLFAMLVFHAGLNVSLNVLLPLRAGWAPALVAWAAVLVIVLRCGRRNLSAHERYATPAVDGRSTVDGRRGQTSRPSG